MADDPGVIAAPASTDAPAVEPAIAPAPAAATSLLSVAPTVEAAAAVPAIDPPVVADPALTVPVDAPPEIVPQIVEPTVPSYADFTFPEGVTADPELVKGASELFAGDRLTQEQAQRYVDYHTDAMQKFAEQITAKASADQWKVFADTNNQLVREFEEDPFIGGNRKETTLTEARFAMKELSGGKEQLEELQMLHANTIAGNHRAEIRAWAEAGRRIQQIYTLTQTNNWSDAMQRLQEPQKPPPANPTRSPGNNGARPADRRYGNSPTTRT